MFYPNIPSKVQVFHPNHSIVLELQLNVANKLCRDEAGNLSPDPEKLIKKQELCEHLMGVLDIVYPGRSKYRGLILHELAETVITLTGKLFHENKLSIVSFHFLQGVPNSNHLECLIKGTPCIGSFEFFYTVFLGLG